MKRSRFPFSPEAKRLLLSRSVFRGVMLGGFVMVMFGVEMVPVRSMRMMCALRMIAGLVVFCCLFMVGSGVPMMFGGFLMMVRAFVLRHFDAFLKYRAYLAVRPKVFKSFYRAAGPVALMGPRQTVTIAFTTRPARMCANASATAWKAYRCAPSFAAVT